MIKRYRTFIFIFLLSLFLITSPSFAANWVKEFLAANPDVAAKPIAERGQFHYAVKNPDNSRTYYFTEIPNHYFKDGEWKPLDTKLVYYADTDEYGAEGLQTRLKLNGGARILDAIYNHVSLSVGRFDETTKTFTLAAVLPDGVVSEDSITRSIGKFTHKITLTETGLREYMVINSAVTVGTNEWLVLEAVITVPKPQEYSYSCPTHGDTCIPNPDAGTTMGAAYICSVDGEACTATPLPIENRQLWEDGWVEDTSVGKYQFPKPTGVDATGKEVPIRRYAIFKGGKQYLFTGIRGSNLTGVTYPVTIDPDYSDMTADGYVIGTNASYATARSTSTAFDITSTTLTVGASGTTGFNVFRGFLKFNTLTLPSAATITQVNLKLTATTDNSTTDFDVQIVKQGWSAQDPITATTREAAYDGCLAGTADSNIWRNTSGMSINTTYTSGNLDTTYPTKGGFTYYSLRSSLDFAGTQPSGDADILLASQENTTAAYRPVLVITATAKALSGYSYKKEIYLDTTSNGAAITSNQLQFPIAVHINSSSWSTGAELARVLNAANTDGKRLNFYTSDDQTWPISYEVEFFSSGTEAIYWVGVPTVTHSVKGSGTTNTLWVGYEDSSGWPAADQSNKVGVWDVNTMMVQHLGESGTLGTTYDSTINANNGTRYADVTQATGQVKYGQTFDGTGDYISISDSTSLDIGTSDLTLRSWIKTTDTAGSILFKRDPVSGSNPGYTLHITTDGKLLYFLCDGSATRLTASSATGGVADNNWHYIGVVFDRDASAIFYIDGAVVSGGGSISSQQASIANARLFYVAAQQQAVDPVSIDFTGILDEISVSNIVRSADWIKLEYYSMKKTAYNGDTGVGGTGYPIVSWGTEQGAPTRTDRMFLMFP